MEKKRKSLTQKSTERSVSGKVKQLEAVREK